jgi:hypothetical protein
LIDESTGKIEQKMNKFRILKSIIFIWLFIIVSCGENTFKNEISKNKQSKRIKGCFLKYNSNLTINQNFDSCTKIIFLPSKLYLLNDDYGYSVESLNIKGNYNYYYIFSVPTGRFKLIRFNSSQIQESGWCDDDSSGDSLIINTINERNFKVLDNTLLEMYTVNWLTSLDILRRQSTKISAKSCPVNY